MAFSSSSSNQGTRTGPFDERAGHMPRDQAALYSQRGQNKPTASDFAKPNSNISAVLNEAVETVVNSFAKHTHGYGRGRLWVQFICTSIAKMLVVMITVLAKFLRHSSENSGYNV